MGLNIFSCPVFEVSLQVKLSVQGMGYLPRCRDLEEAEEVEEAEEAEEAEGDWSLTLTP
jgi:hypothetical protein